MPTSPAMATKGRTPISRDSISRRIGPAAVCWALTGDSQRPAHVPRGEAVIMRRPLACFPRSSWACTAPRADREGLYVTTSLLAEGVWATGMMNAAAFQ